jgi:hypothetical protein
VVAGKPRHGLNESSAVIRRQRPREWPALFRAPDLSGIEQVKALLNFIEQTIGDAMELLVIADEAVEFLLEQFVNDTLVGWVLKRWGNI